MDTSHVRGQISPLPGGLDREGVRRAREKWGENRLVSSGGRGLGGRILGQLADPMVLLLLGAAGVSLAACGIGEGLGDALVILAVVLLNTVLGVVQETRAEAALEALRDLTPPSCRVRREGEVRTVRASELVPGDIVLLRAGDTVPADGRLHEAFGLAAEEAALTGEAEGVEKRAADASLDGASGPDGGGGDPSAVYMGTHIIRGRGEMTVTATGMRTAMGRIAHDIGGENLPTPLQRTLKRLSGQLTALTLCICALIFFLRMSTLAGGGGWKLAQVTEAFLLAVSLAVAAIPEGMVAVVTVVLSMGVARMAKQNAIVRRLTAVETLGATGVICTDKTGTLTCGKMTVAESHPSGDAQMLARALALCGDAPWEGGEGTEGALLAFSRTKIVTDADWRPSFPRLAELPFDSSRKRMSTLHQIPDGMRLPGLPRACTQVQFTKGAPDALLPICTSVLTGQGVCPLDGAAMRYYRTLCDRLAAGALRVIGAAYRPGDGRIREEGLTLLGLVALRDPLRPEVPDAIERCRRAGIRVVMITGDHPDTAGAIAAELGLIPPGGREGAVILGQTLSECEGEALAQAAVGCSVFARVRPEHKMQIVQALRACGQITAMTGDGINDAPALKKSDIGIGMGKNGTDVTRECADLILADDNFATIVCAVEEGRRIWDNVCRAIHFLLSSNLSEVITVFAATLWGVELLSPIHLLFINLITDSLPALALGMERAEEDAMSRPPRPSSEGIFAHGAPARILIQGCFAAALTLVAFLLGAWLEGGCLPMRQVLASLSLRGSAAGRTMAFVTMALSETLHSLNMRSLRASLFTCKGHNPLLYGAVIFSVLLTASLIYVPPLTALFALEQIPFSFYLLSLLLAALMIPLVELQKALSRPKNVKNGGTER